jgi:ribonuclease G
MKRLLIAHRPNAVFTAITENEKLTELFIDPINENNENNENGSWVGRIVVGRIKTILPGQFAFIDIGGKKNAFINLHKGHGLKAGLPVLVQVQKDAVGTKGMMVSLEISLKGRLVVLCATGNTAVGISRKIEDEKESRRLRKIARKHLPSGYSIIIRTNAKNQPAEEIAAEIADLHKTHTEITTRAEFIRPPATLHPTSQNNYKNLLADLVSQDLDEIHICAETDRSVSLTKDAICSLLPEIEPKISHQPVHLEKKIKSALEKEVPLPCGGFITIEQTEACVVVDVNTGSNVDKTYSEAVLETNLEAAAVLAAQIRLRNLSGIIIIDFIDMPQQKDKTAVLEALASETKKDRIRVEIIGFIGLGMVQLTRQKIRPPISEFLRKKCPLCGCS